MRLGLGLGLATGRGVQNLPVTLLLEDYPGATAAYSLSKLRPDYSGSCIEVRRSSDNTTANIGFSGNELDTVALLAFVGSGDGFVRTLYDQAGSINLVQTTNGNQPQIVTAGEVFSHHNKPCIYFNDANTTSLVGTNYGNTDGRVSAFSVVARWSKGHVFSVNRTATLSFLDLYMAGTNTARIGRYNASLPLTGSIGNQRQTVMTQIYNGTAYKSWYEKGTDQGTTSPTIRTFAASGTTNIRLGAGVTTNLPGNFAFQTLVIYNSDQNANRAAIENKLETMYANNWAFTPVTFTLPDASGTQAGKGFTITGIAIDRAESTSQVVVWASNHGVDNDDIVPLPDNQASIVKLLLPAFTAPNLTQATKLAEFKLYEDVNFGPDISVQGIAVANDNTIWMAASNGKIYNYTKPVFNAGTGQTTATFIKSYNIAANGLTYDPANDRLIVATTLGVVSFVNPATGVVTAAPANFGTDVDQLAFRSNNVLMGSRGTAVTAGNIVRISTDGTPINTLSNVRSFERTHAPEGIDFWNQYLLFASDAWYHSQTPDNGYNQLNNITVYGFD